MSCPSRERDRCWLEQEIQSDEYRKLLGDLQHVNPFFRQFAAWMEVVVFMQHGTSTDPRKDEVLRQIFEAHSKDKDPRWYVIVLTMFLPGLENLHFQKRYWDSDPENLWSTIMWTANEVLSRIDIKRRPGKLVQKIYNDTLHKLHENYRRIWDHCDCETPVERDELEDLLDEREFSALAGKLDCCVNYAALGLREELDSEIRRLREHLEAGRITEADYLLLVGTKVYGDSLADYAREAGIDYQVAKKRRQRAEAVINRFDGAKK